MTGIVIALSDSRDSSKYINSPKQDIHLLYLQKSSHMGINNKQLIEEIILGLSPESYLGTSPWS